MRKNILASPFSFFNKELTNIFVPVNWVKLLLGNIPKAVKSETNCINSSASMPLVSSRWFSSPSLALYASILLLNIS